MPFVQTTYSDTMRAGLPGMVVNSELQNIITRTNSGSSAIAFGIPVIRSGDHTCVLATQETLEGVGANGASAPAGATIGAITVSAGAKKGIYHLTCVTAGATGKWEVEDPDGVLIGMATTGTVFSQGGLSFTITDSGTDPAIGEQFIITVTATVGTADLDVLGIAVRDTSLDVSAADTFVQYASVPILTRGVIWVTAGASVVAGDDVYWNPATSRYTKTTTHLRMPGYVFDSAGGDGNLVKIARR
jgi:hypothetical protein